MILTIGILIVLVAAFRHGTRKGLVAIFIKLVGFVVVAGLGLYFAPSLGQKLSSIFATTEVNRIFYQMLAFWLIAIIGGLGLRLITNAVRQTAKKIPIISQADRLLGGLFSLAMMYGVIFFLLLLVDTWPGVQPKPFIAESSVAQFMLKKTPVISQQVLDNWLLEPQGDGNES